MSNKIFFKIIVLFYSIISINIVNANELNPEAKNKLVERANKYRAEGNYDAAIIQLDSILAANPKDAGILLYKGDLKLQSKRFKDAIDVYRSILPLNFEKTIVQINLSYALFMNHHPAQALAYAQKAWEENKTNNSAIVNHFNAMLWNIQDKKAKQFLNSQTSQLSPAQNLVLNARLETTRGNFKKGLELYDSLVQLYPNKHYLMEYVEVLIGKKELKTARILLKTNDSFLSPNELKSMEEKLEIAQQQRVGSELVYFSDVAKNNRLETNIFWQQGEGKPYRLGIKAGNIITTSALDEKTTTQFGHITLYEKWGKSWKGQTELKVQQIQTSDSNHFTAILGEQSIKYQPNDRRMVGVYFSSEMLNFTASLIGQNVRSHNLGYVTHIMLNGKTGIYSQGSWGSLNDNNQRYQFFGSLYRLIRTEPTLKTGINFSALHFTDSKKEGYFAPNRFLSTEVFTDYSTALTSTSKYYFTIQAAAGLQKIETQNWDPAFRLQTEVGYRVKHFETSLKYQTSNVAAANGTGYRFNWFTMNLVWKW
jgi:Tfp pilus assembly protein PilF